MIMLFVERSIRWSSTSRPFAMPPSRVTTSKPVLPDWDLAFNAIFFRVPGNSGGLGEVLTYIKKFEKLQIFILNLATFLRFCALYIFLLLITVL